MAFRTIAVPWAVLLLCGLAATTSAHAQDIVVPVHKCVVNGTVTYSDFACTGGTTVELHPGVADPAAALRLQHAQAMLDAAAAQRRANEARDATRMITYGPIPREMDAPNDYVDAAPLYGYDGYYAGNRLRHPKTKLVRTQPPRLERRVVPLRMPVVTKGR